MFGLGIWEIILILLIVMIIFGVGKLPEIGSGLGEGIKNFRKSVKEHEKQVESGENKPVVDEPTQQK